MLREQKRTLRETTACKPSTVAEPKMRKTAGKTAFNSRTVAELGQEVADIMEERVVLEYQLEQLKSIGSQAGADSIQY